MHKYKPTEKEIKSLANKIKGWEIIENHHLSKTFLFPDFKSSLAFVDKVGRIAEAQNHHPNICFTWGKVDISIWTHEINGLSEDDFVLAGRIDNLF